MVWIKFDPRNEENMKETDIAWAAGLFEGEGCIHLLKQSPNAATLRLGTTDLDVLEKFVEIVQYGKIGKVRRTNRSRKESWQWQMSKKTEVVRILNMFLPYFGKRRTEKAYEALDRISKSPGRGNWGQNSRPIEQ